MATLIGNSDANNLTGGNEDDSIEGRGGSDLLFGMGGNDTLIAGPGPAMGSGGSTLDGGRGHDSLSGTSGSTFGLLLGGAGNDVIVSNTTLRDTLVGGAGNDTMSAQGFWTGHLSYRERDGWAPEGGVVVDLLGGTAKDGAGGTDSLAGIDRVEGTDGFGDILSGNAGGNVLLGLGGADTLRGGGGGNDFIDGGAGADSMEGGTGSDAYWVDDPGDVIIEVNRRGDVEQVNATVSYTLPDYAEYLILAPGRTGRLTGTGNAGDNTITGNSNANLLAGLDGNDELTGDGAFGKGADTLIGGLGTDVLDGGRGQDAFRFASAAEGGDLIGIYKGAADRIEVSAAGFGGGLVEGEDVIAGGHYVENRDGMARGDRGIGQFVFEKDAKRLWWDADGEGSAFDPVLLVTFHKVKDWSGAEIVVIA